MLLHNPILPGFYPDPSVCRRGDDLYIATSSFEYFPGIPLFHSRDFVHWRQVGHALTRPGRPDLRSVRASKGIYASTIRYREADGYFYVASTLVKDPPYRGNVSFYVKAKDPAGKWSEPVVIRGAEGIDPTLFFEGDKAYCLGNLRPYPDRKSTKKRHIWLQEMDIETGELTGDRHVLLRDGALRCAATPEGPHLYKVGGWYYLLIAEGGTEEDHAVSVFRSRRLTGPYRGDPRNPVLTHRMLGRGSAIDSTGHADLVQLPNGEWWAVLLACRPDGGPYRNLGRETFAVPVEWEDGWPVFSPKSGRVEFEYPAPALPEWEPPARKAQYGFGDGELGPEWNVLRGPREEVFSLSQRKGWLRLLPNAHTLREDASPAFIGRRQQHMCFEAEAEMEFTPDASFRGGMVMLMNGRHYIAMLYEEVSGQGAVSVYRCRAGQETLEGRIPARGGRLRMKIEARYQSYTFLAACEGEEWRAAAKDVDGTVLSREVAGGFTGAYIGLYCEDAAAPRGAHADYRFFAYRGTRE